MTSEMRNNIAIVLEDVIWYSTVQYRNTVQGHSMVKHNMHSYYTVLTHNYQTKYGIIKTEYCLKVTQRSLFTFLHTPESSLHKASCHGIQHNGMLVKYSTIHCTRCNVEQYSMVQDTLLEHGMLKAHIIQFITFSRSYRNIVYYYTIVNNIHINL